VTPFQFGVLVERGPVTPVTPVALFARCADAVVEHDPAARELRAYFDRAGPPSLAAAVVAAVRDLEASGLAPVAAEPDDDVVTLGAVAARLGVSREITEALLHDAAPVWRCSDEPVYRWPEIASRLRVRADSASARIFEAANLALRLRTLTRADAALAVLTELIDG
jgi:hypothetical protein